MKDVRMEMVLIPSDEVVARVIDGALIIVPLTAGMGDLENDLFSLNETGAAIWNLLDGSRTLGEVAAVLREQYEAESGEIERDVSGIAAELLKRGMLVEAPV